MKDMWKSIPCKISELRLDKTLACGQSFRWKEHTLGQWTGVIGRDVWRLKQTENELLYQILNPTIPSIDNLNQIHDDKSSAEKETLDTVKEKPARRSKCSKTLPKVDKHIKQEDAVFPDKCAIKQELKGEDILQDYFQLHIDLMDLYKTWTKADKNFSKVAKQFEGIRMIRQDPVECLFSFICSSNNNISRITSMIDNLTSHYGDKILVEDGRTHYTFPTVKSLCAEGVEEKLRSLGFGYRAKYIQASARYIEQNGGENWLYSLRTKDYKTAKSELMKLCGVGAKVADCVGLFCLDKHGAIPVDTHVWQIASRDYMPKLKQSKSLTDKLYDEIGDFFRDLWGPYAGWAHSVLFTADLRKFKDLDKKLDIKRKVARSEGTEQEEKQSIKKKTKRQR